MRWDPQGLASNSMSPRGQILAALALALSSVSKWSDLGRAWPLPRKCCPRTHSCDLSLPAFSEFCDKSQKSRVLL